MKLAILFALFAVGRGLVVPSLPESVGTGAGVAAQSDATSTSTPLIRQWANAAFNWLKNLNCSNLHQDFLSADACWIVKLSDKRDIRVYGVEPQKNIKFGLLFPDGGGGGAEAKHRVFHDGVLVVDPFPRARFGHQIVVFHADFNAGAGSQCPAEKGFAVGELHRFISSVLSIDFDRVIEL